VFRALTARNLLLAALGCGALYFIALHPWTGTIGGIVFWLLGRLLPTACVALLALGLAFLLPVHLVARLAVALVLSFVLGVNIALPELPDLFRYRPEITMQVQGRLPPVENPADALRIKRRPWPPLFTRPLAPQLYIGSDEGCMCMYFKERATYSDQLQSTMLRVGGGTPGKVGNFVRATLVAQEANDAHLDVTFWHDVNEQKVVIDIVDHGKLIARLGQRNIPLASVVERKGVGREKLAENFWENAAHLFVRDNAWRYVLGAILSSHYPEQQIEQFLRDAGVGARSTN
jgi:hypothetical protein